MTSAMDHCLALGGIDEVIEYLRELLETQDTRTWYNALTAIAEAPFVHPDKGSDSREHWERLVPVANDGLAIGDGGG